MSTGFPLIRKVKGLIWSGKSGNFAGNHGKMVCIVGVVRLLYVSLFLCMMCFEC